MAGVQPSGREQTRPRILRNVQQKLSCALPFQSFEPEDLSVSRGLQHIGQSPLFLLLTGLAVDLSIPF